MSTVSNFPRRAILMGLLWLPISVGVLYLCSLIGWYGIDYFNFPAAVAVSLPLLVGLVQEVRALRAGWQQMRTQTSSRTGTNVATFALGACVTVFFILVSAMFLVSGARN